jgi:3',5'-cyclic AMP phosphodiesterase CpdA
LSDRRRLQERGVRLPRSARIVKLRLVLIAQLSDIHTGGARYDRALLEAAIGEINQAEPDLVVIAGDVTDEGYPDQYEAARERVGAIDCPHLVVVPGNHDARHVGYLQYERTFGTRDSRARLAVDGTEVALVAVDSSKPDLDEGEIGREHYAWIVEGFSEPADLRIFACHHHLMPIPGTGRERNQVLDAGDVLSLLRELGIDLVLSGHRHVPYVWPVAGMLLIHSGTASTLRTRAFTQPAYNLIRAGQDRVSVELRVPGGGAQSLGEYPREWPSELAAPSAGSLVHSTPGPKLAND